MKALESLLDQQCARILQANRTHAEGLLNALEERQAARFLAIERTAEGVEYKVESFESRLKAVEQKLQRGFPQGEERDRRKNTLVFGGWNPDTRRDTILSELRQVDADFDNAPFTTGPRRAVALANFNTCKGESEAECKARLKGTDLWEQMEGLFSSAIACGQRACC